MIVLHNLTGIYEVQDFYLPYKHLMLEEKHLSGIRGYMEEETKNFLKESIIKNFDTAKVHFLDSGNFHHISFLYTSLQKEAFHLVVFDNHTDMQGSAFGSILSCGSWIMEALMQNTYLKKVIMIGVKADYIKECSYQKDDRVIFLERIDDIQNIEELPIYLSVDKDVLSETEFSCDWDQGKMSVSEFLRQLYFIKEKFNILGVDICGEPSNENGVDTKKSNRINKSILNVFIDFFHL